MKKPLYVVWDWNGTLLNDVDICIKVQNEMLEQRGLRLIDSMDYYYKVFTFPIINYYINLGYDLEKEDFEDICRIYVEKYENSLPDCGLYKDAEDILKFFKQTGIRQSVISAASQKSLQKQMNGKGLDGLLDAAVGISDDMAGSKLDIAKSYISELDVSPGEILFVGDSVHDFEVAYACGCECVLVSAGHQNSKTLKTTGVEVFESLTELKNEVFNMF